MTEHEIKGHFRDGVWQEPHVKQIDIKEWLGDNNPFSERFPISDLNEKQVALLVGFSDIRVSGLGPSPAIFKLTASGIVEVHVRWSKKPNDFGSGGELWIDAKGNYIAAAIWEGDNTSSRGPIRVYRWKPGFRSFSDRAEQILYPNSDNRDGSTQATRAFIKEHWAKEESA